MTISTKTQWLFPVALVSIAALGGCSSSSSSKDGGADTHSTSDAGTDGPQLFGLTPGDTCFDILSVVGTPDDGCNLGVGDTAAMNGLVGTAIAFNYTPNNGMNVATIAIGTNGILGGGPISNNMATVVHDAGNTDATMSTCTWHENVTSMVTLTAQNAFTISVVREQSMFAAVPACTASTIPAGGMCTSTWTWTMKLSAKKPTTNCK